MFKTLKFHILHFQLCWLRASFEAKNGYKPRQVYLSADIFDFMYTFIILNGYRGDYNFENAYEEVFGVPSLSRSNGIKFARYA
jgi:hypothetical protein